MKLQDRFSALERTAAPDLWEEARTRKIVGTPTTARPRAKRWVALAVGLAIGLAGTSIAVVAFDRSPRNAISRVENTSNWNEGSIPEIAWSFRYPPTWHVQPLRFELIGLGNINGALISNADMTFHHPNRPGKKTWLWDLRSLPADGVALSIQSATFSNSTTLPVPSDLTSLLEHPTSTPAVTRYAGQAQTYRMTFDLGSSCPYSSQLTVIAWVGPQASQADKASLQALIASMTTAARSQGDEGTPTSSYRLPGWPTCVPYTAGCSGVFVTLDAYARVGGKRSVQYPTDLGLPACPPPSRNGAEGVGGSPPDPNSPSPECAVSPKDTAVEIWMPSGSAQRFARRFRCGIPAIQACTYPEIR